MKKEEVDVFANFDFGEIVDTNSEENLDVLVDGSGAVISKFSKEDDDDEDEYKDVSIESLLAGAGKEKGVVETQSKERKSEDLPPKNTRQVVSQETSSSTLNAVKIAKAFYEEGGLSSFDEEAFLKIAEEKSPGEALMQMIKNEVDANVEAYKKSLSPEGRINAEAVELGIDPNELQTIENDINILKSITDEQLANADSRAGLLRYYYQHTTQFSEEKIAKEIKKLEDLEEAAEEVKNIIPELIRVREADKNTLKEAAKANHQKMIDRENETLDKYRKTIRETTEIIPGSKINKQTHDKIEKTLLEPVKEVNGRKLNALWAKREEDPQKFDTIVAYMMLEGIFDGKWQGAVSRAKTNAFKDLENSLHTQRTTGNISSGVGGKEMLDSISELENLFG